MELNNGRYKSHTRQQVDDRYNTDLKAEARESGFTEDEKLVLSGRKLALEEHAMGLAGQISYRDTTDGLICSQHFLTTLNELTTNDLVKVDETMATVAGRGMANPALRFHLWIYAGRPEINAIIHTHPPHASALSMLGRPLIAAHMDSAMFYDDCGYLGQWPGVPIGNEEGEVIDAALGSHRSALLAHHGIVATGTSIEEALYLAIHLEHAARLQLLAEAAGKIKPLPEAQAREAHDFLLQEDFIKGTTHAWLRDCHARFPDALNPSGEV